MEQNSELVEVIHCQHEITKFMHAFSTLHIHPEIFFDYGNLIRVQLQQLGMQ